MNVTPYWSSLGRSASAASAVVAASLDVRRNGSEVLSRVHGGCSAMVPTWLPDEDGSRARDSAIAARVFESVGPVPASDRYVASLAWSDEVQDHVDARRVSVNAAIAAEVEAGRLDYAAVMCGATWGEVDAARLVVEAEGAYCLLGDPERGRVHVGGGWACLSSNKSLSDGSSALSGVRESGAVSVDPVGGAGQRSADVAASASLGVPRSRAARVPFRVAADRVVELERVGAFVAGGQEARLAKLRRAVGFTARAHGAERKGFRPDEVRMVTLTYAPGVDWDPGHVGRYMTWVRDWHRVRGLRCRYAWVAEIQDGKRRTDGAPGRGVIHYHVALWVPAGTAHMPMSDKAGWWPHGSTRTEVARGAAAYLMDYLKKGTWRLFHLLPKGARLYGVGGLEHSLRRARRWLGLPGFVRGNSSIHCDWKRAPKGVGGWIAPDGSHYPSEFRRVNVGGVVALQRVLEHDCVIDAQGPFCWLEDREKLIASV